MPLCMVAIGPLTPGTPKYSPHKLLSISRDYIVIGVLVKVTGLEVVVCIRKKPLEYVDLPSQCSTGSHIVCGPDYSAL